MQPLAQDAVKAALTCDWPRAIELNKQILAQDDHDLGALLRLANALLETGNTPKAKKYAMLAKKIDPIDPLVKRCVEKCVSGKFIPMGTNSISRANLKAFLENPGKTHLVRLIHLAEPKVIAQLHPGEALKVAITSHKVTVETDGGTHIGHVPDDIAARVVGAKKSEFWAAVKRVTPSEVSVLLHER